MYRIQRYNALSVFGDMKPHNYGHSVAIGALHFANPVNRKEIWGSRKISRNLYYTDLFEGLMKELFDNGLLQLVDNDNVKRLRLVNCEHKTHPTEDGKLCIGRMISPRDYDVQLTAKGRECLGMEQIARDGDYSFYKNFDGSLDSAQKLNPGLFKGK